MYASRHWGWRRLGIVATLVATVSVGLLLALPRSSAAALDPVLYDQNNNSRDLGIVSSSVDGTIGADDFIVPASGWHLTGVFVRGADQGTLNSVTVSIYSSTFGAPGLLVYTTTVNSGSFTDAADPAFSGIYAGGDLTIPINATLAAGTYFLAVQGGGGDTWYWDERSTASYGGAVWKDPNSVYAPDVTNWTDLGTYEGENSYSLDFIFTLYGTASGDLLTPTDGADLEATEGAALTGGTLGTFTDSNTSALATDFTASIDWGDSTTPSTGTVTGSNGDFTVTGSHTYMDEGDYTVTTTVTDASDNQAVIHTAIHVTDAPLTINGVRVQLKIPMRGSFDSTATLLVKFTDGNPYATADDYTATIQWGDGGTSTLTSFTAAGKGWSTTGQHSYVRGTSYEIAITIDDEGGSQIGTTKTVKVR